MEVLLLIGGFIVALVVGVIIWFIGGVLWNSLPSVLRFLSFIFGVSFAIYMWLIGYDNIGVTIGIAITVTSFPLTAYIGRTGRWVWIDSDGDRRGYYGEFLDHNK